MRLTSLVLAGALAALGAARPARADEVALASTATVAPATDHLQLGLEADGGSDGPVGHLGGALLAGRSFWQLGVGYGRHLDGAKPDRYAILGRLRLLRRGPVALWATAAGSWGYRSAMRQYARPGYDPETLNVSWDPATRVSAGLAGRYKSGRFQLSLEVGAGYNVNKPTCTVSPPDLPCDAPQVKAAYGDLAPFEPGRFTPYLMAGLGVDLLSYADDGGAAEPGTRAPAGAEPSTARPKDPRASEGFVTPTALTQPAGSVTITSRMLLADEVMYAITDRWQVGAGVGYIPQDEGEGTKLANASVKGEILRAGRLRLAVAGGALYATDRSNILAVTGVGPIATLVLDGAGDSTVSVAAVPGVVFSHERYDEEHTVLGPGALLMASVALRLVDHVKLLGEVLDIDGAMWLGIGGARLYWRGLSLDVGAMRDSSSSGVLPVGVLSYRI